MKVVVFGAGAWGTAVAVYCHSIGHTVTLVPKFQDQAEKMISHRENIDFLPGIKLPSDIVITTSVKDAMDDIEVGFLGCPSVGMEDLCKEIADVAKGRKELPLLISLCKGIQNDHLETASDLVKRFLPNFEFAVLAGPTNAKEFAQGKHAAMALATTSPKKDDIQKAFSSDHMRIYTNNDVKGSELGGCLKNVYAIGAGICDGMEVGDNAKAAYLTRALRELITIGVALGGEQETFYGMSGLGDFIATCMGKWSRNRTFGERIGRGETAEEIFKTQKAAVEGYKTSKAFYNLCEQRGIDAPIMRGIFDVLHQHKSLHASIQSILSRPLKSEG